MRRLSSLFVCAVLACGLVAAAAPAAPAARDRRIAPAKARLDPGLVKLIAADAPSVKTVVLFKRRPTETDALHLSRLGFKPPFTRFHTVPALYATGPAASIKRLRTMPNVRYVALSRQFPLAMDRARVVGNVDGLRNVTYRAGGADTTGGFTGKGVGIAIVDSGIDTTHPDLIGQDLADATGQPVKTVGSFVTTADPTRYAFTDRQGLLGDSLDGVTPSPAGALVESHGTHVAGIAAGSGVHSNGKYAGVATGASLIGLTVLDPDVSYIDYGRLIVAMDWLHAHHAEYNIRIVNNSWGGPSMTTAPGRPDPADPLSLAIKKVIDDGLVMVFAAGNDYGDGSAAMTGPEANTPGVISVANYDDETGELNDSSSRGAIADPETWPDVAAPGTNITSAVAMNANGLAYGTGLLGDLTLKNRPIINAPVPTYTEAGPAGVGRYGTITGTSMASPFVAGVAALILEANPNLSASDVRTILRGTASMPANHTLARDEFAWGHGVVNAARAVAAALRMREGLSAERAVASATTVLDTTPWQLNTVPHRDIVIDAPATVQGKHLRADVTFKAGTLNDITIPLRESAAGPDIAGEPQIYQQGIVATPTSVYQGTTVDLAVRFLESAKVNFAQATATHVVTRDGTVAFGPWDATIDDEPSTSSTWDVPADALPGDYTFESSFTYQGNVYAGPTKAFTIDAVPPALPSLGASKAGTPVFQDGFEAGAGGWTSDNKGTLGGDLTDWTYVGPDAQMSGWSPHTGNSHFYVGHAPGADVINGFTYEPLADTTLLSPVIDLTNAADATVSYWRIGSSYEGYDLLHAGYVDADTPGAAPVSLQASTGLMTEWTEGSYRIPGGKRIRLAFQFTSAGAIGLGITNQLILGGWYLDDVTVTPTNGPARLAADTPVGFKSLTTNLTVLAADIGSYTLDFGDGSPLYTGTSVAPIEHTYATPGQYTPSVTIHRGSATEVASTTIDVIPDAVVQLKLGDVRWQNLGAALIADKTFRAKLPVAGLAPGPVTLTARHCVSLERCTSTSKIVTIE